MLPPPAQLLSGSLESESPAERALQNCNAPLLIGKQLYPVVYTICIHIMAYSDIFKVFIQNICPMAITVHPGVHYLFRGFLPPCNVFTASAEGHSLLSQHTAEAAAVRSGMGKFLFDFLCSHISVMSVFNSSAGSPAFALSSLTSFTTCSA